MHDNMPSSANTEFSLVSTHAQIFHLVEKVDFRLADDACFFHALAQFCRSHKFLHPGGGVPLTPHHQVVRIFAVATDVKTFFAGRLAPDLGGIDHTLPLGVIGNSMTDENV